MSDWIQIFRTGDYGPKGRYTEGDLDRIVANYRSDRHEAPLVIGHPEHNKPAFGWVESLKRDGASLLMKTRQVQPGFMDLVKSGAFKKRSIALYKDLDGKGPYLRHVGFLGAMAPEVKGLADLKFLDGDYVGLEFDETELSDNTPKGDPDMDNNEVKKTVLETMKETFSEFFLGKKEPGAGPSLEDVRALITKELEQTQQKFSEQINSLSEENKELKAELAKARQSTLDTSKQGKIARFCESLAGSGQFPPAFKEDGLVKFMESLPDEGKTVTFGEGDGKKEFTPLEFFMEWMKKLPKIVPFGEIVTGTKEAKGRRLVNFNHSPDSRTTVDLESIQLAEEAEALAAEKKIPYGEALTALKQQRVRQPA